MHFLNSGHLQNPGCSSPSPPSTRPPWPDMVVGLHPMISPFRGKPGFPRCFSYHLRWNSLVFMPTLTLEWQQTPSMLTAFSQRKSHTPGIRVCDQAPITHPIVFPTLFLPTHSATATLASVLFLQHNCACGSRYSVRSFPHICMATSLVCFKFWLMSHLLSEVLPNHSIFTLLGLLTLLLFP